MSQFRGLLTFHGIEEHLMQKGQFLPILFVIRPDPLRHKILGYNFLEFIGMVFLVHDPADELIVMDGRVLVFQQLVFLALQSNLRAAT